MPTPNLTCPHCNQQFPLTEALEHEYKETLEAKLKEEFDANQTSFISKLRAELEAQYQSEREASQQSVSDLAAQLESSKLKVKAAQEAELELRQKQNALEEEREEWELIKQREIAEEKAEIQKKAIARFTEEQQLKDKEKEELIKGLVEQINDLKQRAEQGSQQSQGEAQELILETLIREKFFRDEVAPIAKGESGADILQKVFDDFGYHCGTIIWESKRTKSWSNDWCGKLKRDQISSKADISILVTKALPKSINNFGYVDEVWVTEQSYAHGLAIALRSGLLQMSLARRAAENKGEKVDNLYDYLASIEFQHRIAMVVKSFQTMQKDLITEKNAITKQWKKREKQLEQVTESTLEIIGSLQSIMGEKMPEISGLELRALGSGIDDLED